ncbi:MAG: RNA polymerase subunit sigma, partial [Candidatus Zixiibacteriota bacterium]
MYKRSAEIIRQAKRATAFTGAGISVESGIPPFRGEGGLWSRYDPASLETNYFYANPKASWEVIKEIFYDFFGRSSPNAAHIGLALM